MVEKKKEGRVRLRRPIPDKPSLFSVHGVTIVVTQAFCPNGHNLVRRNDVLFDGYPGISLFVECGDFAGEVILSPIHGDHAKIGIPRSLPDGLRCCLKCPECEVELPKIGDCGCEHGGDLIGIYLREDLAEGDMVAICNILGCYRSRVMDKFEILSEFIETGEGETA